MKSQTVSSAGRDKRLLHFPPDRPSRHSFGLVSRSPGFKVRLGSLHLAIYLLKYVSPENRLAIVILLQKHPGKSPVLHSPRLSSAVQGKGTTLKPCNLPLVIIMIIIYFFIFNTLCIWSHKLWQMSYNLTRFVCARQWQKVVEEEGKGGSEECRWRGNTKCKVECVQRSWKKNGTKLCAWETLLTFQSSLPSHQRLPG